MAFRYTSQADHKVIENAIVALTAVAERWTSPA
jgi:hypothetical protein